MANYRGVRPPRCAVLSYIRVELYYLKMRIIGHLDMDAFFAAVEERDNPRFKDKPLVVGADPQDGKGRGVVSTANYKAREYGIRSAMPITQAWRLAKEAEAKGKPPAIFLGVSGGKYSEVSSRIVSIVRRHVPVIEEASIDEMYLDLSFTKTHEAARKLALKIKAEIWREEKLTASVGIGPNKLVAKIASDREKPDGLTVVEKKDIEEFLELLPLRAIPSIGPKTEIQLRARGYLTVKDAKKLSKAQLVQMFHSWGGDLYEKLRGQNDSPLETNWIPKSIGEQETFAEDTIDAVQISAKVKELAEEVFERFSASQFKSWRTVVLTVRFADFETKSRAKTLALPERTVAELAFAAATILMPFLDARENPRRKKIRLLGVRIEKLSNGRMR